MKRIVRAGLLLCGWLGCILSVYAAEPDPKGFSVMERNHIRVKTPELLAKGNSFDLHSEHLPDSAFCFPLPKGKVISAYGARGGHSGSDIKTRANDTIRCVFDGIVRMAKHYGGYGKVVVVRHANGLETIYSHNSKNLVAVGDTVKAGQPVRQKERTGRRDSVIKKDETNDTKEEKAEKEDKTEQEEKEESVPVSGSGVVQMQREGRRKERVKEHARNLAKASARLAGTDGSKWTEDILQEEVQSTGTLAGNAQAMEIKGNADKESAQEDVQEEIPKEDTIRELPKDEMIRQILREFMA